MNPDSFFYGLKRNPNCAGVAPSPLRLDVFQAGVERCSKNRFKKPSTHVSTATNNELNHKTFPGAPTPL